LRGRPAIGLAATLAVTVFIAPAATASDRVNKLASDFWWEGEQSPAVLPAPPTVPPGGLWVSSDPAGPQAVSAVRFVLSADQTDPVLALQVSSAQPARAWASGIVACPTTSSWSAGPRPGAWNARPSGDCSVAQVSGVLSTDGHILSFQLSKLAVAGVADFVLEPVGTPTFDATFEPVTSGDVQSSHAVSPVTPTTSPPATVLSTVPVVTPVGSPTVPATVPVTSAAPVTTPALSPAIAPAAPPTTVSSGAGNFAAPSAPAAQVVRIPTRSWRDRILLGLAIVDIGAYMLWKRRSDGPAPDGLPVRVGKPPPLR
jgi:hypothetical protein